MEWIAALGLFVLAFAAAFAGTGAALRFLERRAILDHPNPRSSHAAPTPRGGGLAVVPVVVVSWIAIGLVGFGTAREALVLSALALGLAALSWADDLKGLAVPWRLAGQVAAVAAALALLPGGGPYFGGLLPPALDLAAAGIAWVWFINLFNFMDGIDGIAGSEAATIGIGAALVAAVAHLGGGLALYGVAVAAAALGFLRWNWQPARIFLGDVGSVPLGFLLGWLLLALAARGQGAAALILALYYLADSTGTLLARASRGEKVWRAHKQHFYQRAVQRGLGHGAVVLAIVRANLVLVLLALVAAWGWPGPALAAASLVVAALLCYLGLKREGAASGGPGLG